MKYFWFGFDDILVKAPEQEAWDILQEPNEAEGWIPVCDTENGKFWFDHFSKRVGLSDDKEVQALTTELLDEMLQIAEAKQAIFFMPPNQMVYIEAIVSKMHPPPLAVLPELSLLNKKAKQNFSGLNNITTQNHYIFDWSQADQGVSRDTEHKLSLPLDHIPSPVLMPASAISSNQVEILGHFTADKQLQFYPTTLDIPMQVQQGNRELGIGLVWTWGWGKRLWQWALPYQAIPVDELSDGDSGGIKLLQDKQIFRLKLVAPFNGKTKIITYLTLQPPVLDWYLHPEENTTVDR